MPRPTGFKGDHVDFRLTELQELLRNNAEEFFAREAPLERVREMEHAGVIDPAIWAQVTELGWVGLAIDEAYGGQGGSLLDTSVLLQEICRAAIQVPFAQTVIGAVVVQQHGSDDLKQSVLPRLVSGASLTPALLEASDDFYGEVSTTYDGSTVSGEKRFVEYGATADLHLVAAVKDGTPGLAIVARDQPGVTTTDLKTIGAMPQVLAVYDHATVEGWIEGAAALDFMRSIGSALTSLEAYSYAQKALDMTVDYVQMRVQFGQPIGAFQAVQNRVADIATIVEASRFLTHELLWQFDQGIIDTSQVAIVKAVTSQMAPQVAMDCHLLHGGIGYMEEYNLQFFTRRGKEASLRWGSNREALSKVADAVLS